MEMMNGEYLEWKDLDFDLKDRFLDLKDRYFGFKN